MPPEFSFENCQSFVEVACRRGFLSDQQATQLLQQCRTQSVPVAELAVASGDLEHVQVDIVEAFMAPKDLAPGYELIDVLGSGALGVVYRARQPHLKRDVAIKSIIKSRLTQQNVIARFQQEGAAIGQLQHPNIISAIDLGTHRNRLYLVMELVEGEDVRERLSRGPIDADTALHITRQVAAGLQHALSHQIIHRDIKPGNLILTNAPAGFQLPPGVPLAKIADFGLARLNPPGAVEDTDTRLTISGAALGTPMYCAPEQLTGDDITHQADIYSLGATLFQMLTAHPPFDVDSIPRLMAAKINGDLPQIELLPEQGGLRELVTDMMASNPTDRVADYGEVIGRLDDLQSVPSASSREINESGTKSDPAQRRPWLRMVAATGLAIVAVVVFLLLRPSEPNVPPMVPSGWEEPLFDGANLTPWRQRGSWYGAQDDEGGRVLVGSGFATRRLPQPPPEQTSHIDGIGIRAGVNLRDASSAELHFGFDGDNLVSAPRIVVRLTTDELSVGKRQGVEGPLELSADPVAARPSSPNPSYREIRVQWQGRYWVVYFEGQKVGTVESFASQPVGAIQLVARDGTVFFENLSAFGLQLDPSVQATEIGDRSEL